MSRLLQAFNFKSTRYERPNQKWVCGNAAFGKPCKIGPGKNGVCRATFECTPRQDGPRWVCTRAPGAGGSCAKGPLPDGTCCNAIQKCVPRRSLRAKRGRLVLWVLTVTVGFLILSLHGSARNSVLSPGDVTLSHSEVGGCVSCHQNLDKGVGAWVEAALFDDHDMTDAKQCLSCHEMGEHAFFAHSLAPAALNDMTEVKKASVVPTIEPLDLSLSRKFFNSPQEADGNLACATCHKEHNGLTFDLTAMGNGQCQSCHSARFESFSEGHPPLKGYPGERRTPIIFDHVSHITRHFEKAGQEKAPSTCTGCHTPASNGGAMLVRSFAETCAACHQEQIEGEGLAGRKGIAFLGVPGFDVESLRDQNLEIGDWPEWAEEPPTPFVELLLSRDPAIAGHLERVAALDRLDLSEASAEDLAAVEAVIWGFKELVHDLMAESPEGFAATLSGLAGEDMGKDRLSRLVAGLPLDTLRAAQESWFPNLFQEVSLHRQGLPLPSRASEEEEDASTMEETADVAESDGDGSILGGDEEILGAGDDILSGAGEDILSGGEDILSGAGEDILSGGEDILSGAGEDILSGGEDILSGDGDILSGDEGDIISDDGSILGGDEIEFSTEDSEEESEAPEMVEAPEIDAEAWAALGGWYREEYGLVYRPVVHEDAFMQTWVDLAAFSAAKDSSVGQAIFDQLTDKDAPGKCVKCHSIEAAANGGVQMMWGSSKPDEDLKQATKFFHETHFSLLDQKGCLTCHQVNNKADYLATYQGTDPHDYVSTFNQIENETCAACHQPEQAGDGCLLCHEYHVGRFETRNVATDMVEGTKGESPEAAAGETQN